jgi:hypothetical protein
MEDLIVEKIRNTRRQIEAECDGDFKKLFQKIIESQKKHSNKIVSRKPRILSRKKIA